MIEVKIIADSLNPTGDRLTTFVLTYPRFIHAEVMTHRVFSRNASSSRAIPVKKQIQMVVDNPVIPLAFTKNKAGMQGGAALTGDQHDQAVASWLSARDMAVIWAKTLADLEVHKQYANRILEPFAHITVVLSGTDFNNFFALRCHEAAQPEIRVLAEQMYVAMQVNEPDTLKYGEWHLPFITQKEKDVGLHEGSVKIGPLTNDDLVKMSVARCARVSYLTHEGKSPTFAEDLALYDRLVGAAPIHASPAEHQASAALGGHRSGNLVGFLQYRKTLPNENIENFEGS